MAAAGDPLPMLEGDALVRASINDEMVPAHDGTHLLPGTGIRAPAGSVAVVKITESMSLRMAPETTMSLRPLASLPAEHPGAAPLRSVQVLLTEGEIDVEVKDPNLGLIVQLPNGRSLGVWRGSANVALRGDAVAVAVYDGMAIAGAGTKWKPLSGGNGIVVPTHGDPSPLKAIPPRPEWNETPKGEPQAFAMVRDDEKAVLGATWDATKGAGSYRVELSHEARAIGKVTSTSTDIPAFKTPPVPAGAYALRVRALSPDGIAGLPSVPKPLRVLRVSLPASAFAASDGAIVLPPNAGITLDDPKDLQVATAFDGSELTAWSPASSTITLGAASRRDVHIRHASSRVESRLLLVRRELKAKVSFNPRRPRWPADPVDIVVKVEDVTGYLDASKEKIDVDVRIDIDRVDLSWKQSGDTWTARLAPRAKGAPWVVRVNVADKAGVPIGANLLDIDGPPDSSLQRAAFFHTGE